MRKVAINRWAGRVRTEFLGTLPCPPIRLHLNSEKHSRRRAIIVPEQPAEYAMASHAAPPTAIATFPRSLVNSPHRPNSQIRRSLVNSPAFGPPNSAPSFDNPKCCLRTRKPRFRIFRRSLVNSPTGQTSKIRALWLTSNSDARHPNCALCFGVRKCQNLGEVISVNPPETATLRLTVANAAGMACRHYNALPKPKLPISISYLPPLQINRILIRPPASAGGLLAEREFIHLARYLRNPLWSFASDPHSFSV